MSLTGKVFSAFCRRSDAKRDAGLLPLPDVTDEEGNAYGAHAEQTYDVYRPAGRAEAPVLVNVHGGGFVYGGTAQYRHYCRALARGGFCVVSVNYRLAPAFRFPTQVRDVAAGVCAALAEKFPAARAFGMIGDSAGANLIVQYLIARGCPEYAAGLGIAFPEAKACAAVLNCGVYDLNALRGVMGGGMLRDYVPAEKRGEIGFLRYLSAAFPPAFVMTAPGDFLREEGIRFSALLSEKGAKHVFREYGDKKTGHVFHLDVRAPLARQVREDELAFLRARFADNETE